MLNPLTCTLTVLALASAATAQSSPPPQSYPEASVLGAAKATPGTKPLTASGLTGTRGPTSSGVTFYTDRATFEGTVPGLCNKEDFNASLTPDVGVHAQPLWVCTSDPNIAPGDIEGGMGMRSSDPADVLVTLAAGFIGQPTVVAGTATFLNYTILDFCNEPFAVGFDVFSNGPPPDPIDIRAFDCDGNLLGATQVGASATTPTFIGMESLPGCPPIWRVEIESVIGAGELVDDVTFSGYCDPILGADAKKVVAGDMVNLAISEVANPSRGLLFVTCIDSVPVTQLLGFGMISVVGTECLGPFAIPASPAVTVGLQVFLLDSVTGGISSTNKKTLFIN